jgi:hypothetical protein
MNDENRHLLIRLYQMFRTARMSSLYYENRLWWANFWNLSFEIAIAVGATSSGVAAWALWKDGIGIELWGIITGVSTLSAILKPILAPARYIETSTRQHQGWHSFFFAIDKLILDIRENNDFTKETRRRFDTLYDRNGGLTSGRCKMPKRTCIEQNSTEG